MLKFVWGRVYWCQYWPKRLQSLWANLSLESMVCRICFTGISEVLCIAFWINDQGNVYIDSLQPCCGTTVSVTAIYTQLPLGCINFFALKKGYNSLFPLLPPLGQLATGCRKEPVCFPVPAELYLVQHGEQLLTSTLGLQVCNHLGGKEAKRKEERGGRLLCYNSYQERLPSLTSQTHFCKWVWLVKLLST